MYVMWQTFYCVTVLKHKNTQFLVIEMDEEEPKSESSPSSLDTAEIEQLLVSIKALIRVSNYWTKIVSGPYRLKICYH